MATYVGNFTNLKLVREGREALSFNEEETKALGFTELGGTLRWNVEASLRFQAIEVDLGENVTSIVKDLLLKLNDEEKLTESHIDLYDKFVGE